MIGGNLKNIKTIEEQAQKVSATSFRNPVREGIFLKNQAEAKDDLEKDNLLGHGKLRDAVLEEREHQ